VESFASKKYSRDGKNGQYTVYPKAFQHSWVRKPDTCYPTKCLITWLCSRRQQYIGLENLQHCCPATPYASYSDLIHSPKSVLAGSHWEDYKSENSPIYGKISIWNFSLDKGEIIRLLSTRSRLFVTSILLCLALGATIFCAIQTVRAIQRFQQARSLTAQGDVSNIQPWMTIHYISRVYSVPEGYLTAQLSITDTRPVSRIPLRSLAVRYNRSLDGLIRDVQIAIKVYRKQNPQHGSFTDLHAKTLLAWERNMT